MDCPFCAETIKNDALKCKHCGEWLNTDGRRPPTSEELEFNEARRSLVPAWIVIGLMTMLTMLWLMVQAYGRPT